MLPGPSLTVERQKLNNEVREQHERDDTFWTTRPMFKYFREWGIDAGGITRDVFTQFWEMERVEFCKNVSITCFGTEKCTTGCLCDLYSRPFVQGFVLAKHVPYYFSEALVLALFCLPDKVTTNVKQRCVQLFKKFWPNYIQHMLEESCKHGVSSMYKDELEVLFAMYGSRTPLLLNDPKQFQLRLEQVVTDWMFGIHTPHFINQCRWRLFQMLGPLGPANAREIWKSLRPSGADVINKLVCARRPDEGTSENRVFEFLKSLLSEKNDDVDQIRKSWSS